MSAAQSPAGPDPVGAAPAPRKKPAPAKKPATAKSPGRPRIPFDGSDRDKVRLLALAGTRQDIIAAILGCSIATLARRFRAELDVTPVHAHALLDAVLLDKALSGELPALIWYDKSRRGIRDTARLEHGGIDGRPIELKDMSRYSDEQLDLLERAANLLVSAPERVASGAD